MRKQKRGARLLHRHVGAEDRCVRGAHEPQEHAVGVDHRERHLRARAERLADLGASALRHAQRLGHDRGDLGLRHQAVGAGGRRKALRAGAIVEHEGVQAGERAARVGAIAGGGGAVRGACRDQRRAEESRHVQKRAGQRAERRRRNTPGHERFAVDETQAPAVDQDALGAAVHGRVEAARAGERDQLVDAVVNVGDVEVDAVDAVGDDADAADQAARLIER